jgi:hypothetical protein
MLKRFYRSCFYEELTKVFGSHGASRGNSLSKFLALRISKIKAMYAVFKSKPALASTYPFLCSSISGCRLPTYLRCWKAKPSEKNRKKSKPCSKSRYCAYCWVRMTCKSYCKMTKGIDKELYPGYEYFYNEKVLLLSSDVSYEVLAEQGLALFAHRNKYGSRKLVSAGIAGIAESLVVHSCNTAGTRMFKLTLRQVAYCHKDSRFAKSALAGSPRRFGKAAIMFCSFPVSMLYDGPLRSIRLDEAFRRRRLVRQYGIFYNSGAPSGDVSTE